MKAEDLLLTDEERQSARDKGWDSLRGDWMVAAEETLCSAQAAKVLSVLLREARSDLYDEWHFINTIITETGLTWPPKEG